MKFDWKRAMASAACAALILAGCQKSESPGANASGGSSAAPAAAPDPHPPLGILDSPRENAETASGSWGYGWALDDSGIAQVTVSVDGGAPAAAKTGDPFPGVAAAYPNMPDNDKAGFIFAVPSASPGPHMLTVTIVAKDGGKVELKRQIRITSSQPKKK